MVVEGVVGGWYVCASRGMMGLGGVVCCVDWVGAREV